MGAARFVGRVGGLAVALGVGAAVSFGCATAWADDTGGGGSVGSASDSGGASGGTGEHKAGSSSTSSSTDSGETDPSTTGDTDADAADSTSTKPDTDADADAPDGGQVHSGAHSEAPADDVGDDTDDPSTAKKTTHRRQVLDTTPDESTPTSSAPGGETATITDTETDVLVPDPPAALKTTPTDAVDTTLPPRALSAPTLIDTGNTVVAAPEAATAPAETTTDVLTGVAASDVLGNTTPGHVPVDSPADWIVLAVARGELGDPEEDPTLINPSVTTGETVDPGAAGIKSLVAQPLAATFAAPLAATDAAPDPLGTFVSEAFKAVGGLLSAAVIALDNTITGALGLVSGSIGLAAAVTDTVLTAAINTVNWGITTTTDLITGAMTAAVDALANAFESGPIPLGNLIGGALTFVKNVVTTTVKVLSTAATGVLSFTGVGLSTAVNLLSGLVTGAINVASYTIDVVLKFIAALLNPTPAGTPVVTNDLASTVEDTALVIAAATLLANDSDPDGDALSITAVGSAGHGTTSRAADGTITYTPAANYNGTDSFTYTVSDGTLANTATVTVTVTPVNDAPVATDDTRTTPEDTPLVVAPNVLLANDTDVDGNTLTITAVGSAGHGTTSKAANGTITYTPAANFNGTDSFTYTVSDGSLTDTATVNVTVTPVNDAPVATDDTRTTVEDTPLVIAPNVLLANDTDVEGSTLSITAATQGGHGSTSRAADGTITYTPAANYNGTDSFTYTVSDGSLTDTATVTVTVTPVNDAPVAVNDSVSTAKNTALVIAPNMLLANDTDADGNTLTITAAGAGGHGSTSRAADGTITYTPDTNFTGADSFTYTISDGTLNSTATVTVAVTNGTHAPVAGDDTRTTAEDTALVIAPNVLLANDTDADADTLSITAATQGAHGSTSRAADGTITYTPAANYNGTDSFTYTVSDGALTDTATVTVTITPVNDAPTNGTSSPGAPNAVTGVVTGTVAATDVDGDTLTYSAPASTAKGSITMAGNTFTYTPTDPARAAAGAPGATDADKHDTFTVTANDAHGGTLPISVTVTIAPPAAGVPTTVSTVGTVVIDGVEGYRAVLNSDGTLAIVITHTNTESGFTVVDTGTGEKVGTTVTFTGDYGQTAAFNSFGTRAVVTAKHYDDDTSQIVTSVVVINTTTGAQVGSTRNFGGSTEANVQLNKDGSRVVVVTAPVSDDITLAASDLVLINTETGAQVLTRTFTGVTKARIGSDGTRIAVTVVTYLTDTPFDQDDLSSKVTVINAADGTQVGSTITKQGYSVATPNADGSRLIISTITGTYVTGATTTTIAEVNSSTSAQIGSGVVIANGQTRAAAAFSADGSRAAVIVDFYSSQPFTAKLAVINMNTGALVGGSAVPLGPTTVADPVLTPDGTRAVQVTRYTDYTQTGWPTTVHVTIVDTGTAAVVASLPAIDGDLGSSAADSPLQFSLDGTRAIVTTHYDDLSNSTPLSTTRVTVLNTATGAVVGTPATVNWDATTRFTADGSRVIVTSKSAVSANVTILDAATGATVATLPISGAVSGTPQLSADGSLAVVTSVSSGSTHVVVFDTATGAQIGSTFNIAGTTSTPAQLSADGTHVVMATTTGDRYVGFTTTVSTLEIS